MNVKPGILRSTFLWGKVGELKGLNNSSIGTQSIYCSRHSSLWDKGKPCFSLSFLLGRKKTSKTKPTKQTKKKNTPYFFSTFRYYVAFFHLLKGVILFATPSSASAFLFSSYSRPYSVKKYESPRPLQVCELLVSRR